MPTIVWNHSKKQICRMWFGPTVVSITSNIFPKCSLAPKLQIRGKCAWAYGVHQIMIWWLDSIMCAVTQVKLWASWPKLSLSQVQGCSIIALFLPPKLFLFIISEPTVLRLITFVKPVMIVLVCAVLENMHHLRKPSHLRLLAMLPSCIKSVPFEAAFRPCALQILP